MSATTQLPELRRRRLGRRRRRRDDGGAQPGHRRDDRRRSRAATAADVDRAVEAAVRALPGVARDDAARARRVAAEARRRARGARRRAGARSSRRTSGSRWRAARDEMPGDGGQPALLRGRGAHARRALDGRVHARTTPRGSGASRSASSPGSLPGTTRSDGDLEAGTGARGGKRPGAEAVGADAADAAALRAARAGHPAAGRPERDHGRRRPRRRGARPPSGRPAGLAHGRRRDRAGSSPRRRPQTLKRVHLELGGKAPVRRLRRRRPGRARRDGQGRRLLELGPGLHGRLAHRRGPKIYDRCWRSSCRPSSR